MRQENNASSSNPRRVHVKAALAVCTLFVLVSSACGGSASVDDASSGAVTQDASDAAAVQAPADVESDTAAPDPSAAEPAEAETETADEQPVGPASLGQGAFELVLENGETFSAPVRCELDSEISADQEVLFYAGGNHEGQIYDVTQWGENSFGGTQEVEILDRASYDTLWRSAGGTGLVLELNGNVITGSGGFYQGDDLNGEKTQGELTVSC